MTTILSIVIAGFIGYVFGVLRDQRKFIKEKRIEIYSDLIGDIHHRFTNHTLEKNLKRTQRKIKELKNIVYHHKSKKDAVHKQLDIDLRQTIKEIDKLEEMNNKAVEIFNINNALVNKLSKARLVASKSLEENLREYFSLISELRNNKTNNQDEIDRKINKETMIIEQKMREEITGCRTLSDKRIERHTSHKK